MTNGRNKRARRDEARVDGPFVALPWDVLDSLAYGRLSHPARSLLLEFARQVFGDNNGRLLATADRLRPRGWNSSDVITRAKRELLEAGFIVETVKGGRPNRASWYAVTWYKLAPHRRYDYGVDQLFRRGSYRPAGLHDNTKLRPPRGARPTATTPPDGAASAPAAPSNEAMQGDFVRALHRQPETI